MMRLFIELYTDEDVDVLIADLLRARGFSVLTTRDAGRLYATDEEQLAFAGGAQITAQYKPQARAESGRQFDRRKARGRRRALAYRSSG
jgi:hypothetical protein